MKYIKIFFQSIINYINSIISFENKKQTSLIISFICLYYHIWTLKLILNNQIKINNLYELIFFSENIILIFICLLFNNLYKMYEKNKEKIDKSITKIVEKKLNTDIDGDGKI